MNRRWTLAEVGQHRSPEDCWMAIHGKVYNITSFLALHPGGRAVLLRNCGTDASAAFEAVHPAELLEEHLRPEQCLGDVRSAPQQAEGAGGLVNTGVKNVSETIAMRRSTPPVEQVLSIAEMEGLAMQLLSPKAISYYASATDDEMTKKENRDIYKSILLRPRVFVDCTECSLSTTILGHQVGLPIYVAPAAMARLAHPSGEAGIASACSAFHALQIISKNASLSPADIVQAGPDAVFGWQLYVLKDIAATERTLAQIRSIPQIRFIVLTLDAPIPGKREADERFKMEEAADGVPPQSWGTEGGLTWEKTLRWLTTQTRLPIVLKGIQTHEDAYIASLFPAVKGIVLSNHGGRALDTAPTPMQVLLEIRKFCPSVLERLEVLVDGGIQRGTDVVKALALGARAVGIGRAALYGLAVGGEGGVAKVLSILAAETATAMRLLGVQRVSQLSQRHVNTERVSALLFDGPSGLDKIVQGAAAGASKL